jgi:hypothetical protein
MNTHTEGTYWAKKSERVGVQITVDSLKADSLQAAHQTFSLLELRVLRMIPPQIKGKHHFNEKPYYRSNAFKTKCER